MGTGAIEHLTSAPGMRNLLTSCWSGEYKRGPKQYRVLQLLLITSQDATDPGSSCHSTRIILDARGGKQPIALPTCNVYESQQWPPEQDIPKGAIMARMS